jgi:hypothetical protein
MVFTDFPSKKKAVLTVFHILLLTKFLFIFTVAWKGREALWPEENLPSGKQPYCESLVDKRNEIQCFRGTDVRLNISKLSD